MSGTDRDPDLLRLRLLGGFEVQVGQGPITIPAGRKVRALMACLALPAGRAWPREKLMAMLWSDRGDEQARASLRQVLADVRRELHQPSAVRTEHDAVSLDPTLIAVDALEFEQLAKAARWEAAAGLYRGPLLDGYAAPDDAFEDWIRIERTRLHDLAVDVLERLVAAESGEAAIGAAQRLLALDPAREATHRMLMRLYAAAGQRSQALRQYEHCRDTLQRDLQAKPDAETERLYREIQRESTLPQTASSTHAASGPPLPHPDRPSIAVLPFINMSGDPEQEYFSDGITEDIITELSRFHSLLVIARNSAFAFKGKSLKVQDIGRELGIDYVVEGGVRRSGERLRLTAQFVEVISGRHIWAERYDRDVHDIFDVQDELAHAIAATVGAKVEAVQRDSASRLSPSALLAHDLVLRAKAHVYKFTRADLEQALEMARRAIEIDATSARASACYAHCCSVIVMAYWASDRDRLRLEALEFAKRAVTLDAADNYARWILGFIHNTRREYEDAHIHLCKALENNPNDTEARGAYAILLLAIGQPEAAIQQFELMKRQNPFDLSWFPWVRGLAYLSARRYNEAIATFKQIPEPNNEIRGYLAACYAYVGKSAEAKATIEEFLCVAESDMPAFPGRRLGDWDDYWRNATWYQREEDHDHLMEGLRRAGLLD